MNAAPSAASIVNTFPSSLPRRASPAAPAPAVRSPLEGRDPSPTVIEAANAAIAAVRAAHSCLPGRLVSGVLSAAPRDVWLRYYALNNPRGESARQWLYRATASPALVELS
jgi:hypothetical protein